MILRLLVRSARRVLGELSGSGWGRQSIRSGASLGPDSGADLSDGSPSASWIKRVVSSVPGLSLSRIGAVLVIGGAALLVSGLVFPGLVAWLVPVIAQPELSDNGLIGLGVACLAFALLTMLFRKGKTEFPPLSYAPPETGKSSSLATSGRDFTRRFQQAQSVQHLSVTYHSPSEAEIDQRLRDAAIGTYRRRHGVSESEAIQQIEAGDWTDDPIAAAALGGDDVIVPSRLWLRRRLDPGGAYEQEVERTTAAINRLETND